MQRRLFIALSLVVLSLALLTCVSFLPAYAAENCQLNKVADFDLSLSGGHAAIPILVNDQRLRFIVDTGATRSSLSTRAVQQLGLSTYSPGNARVYTLRGARDVNRVRATLIFGRNIARNAELLVLPDDVAGSNVDGIIGYDYLRNFDLDFDFAGRKLNFFAPDHCKNHVVYWAGDVAQIPFRLEGFDSIEIPVTLDGIKLKAQLDTGASSSMLEIGVAKRKFDLTENSEGAESPGEQWSSQSILKFRKRFKMLGFEGLNFNNPLIYVRDNAMEKALSRNNSKIHTMDLGRVTDGPELLIGMDMLSKMHVYIDYKQKNIYMSAAAAPAASPPSATTTAADSGAEPPVAQIPKPNTDKSVRALPHQDPNHPLRLPRIPPEILIQSETKAVGLEVTVDTKGNVLNAAVISSSGSTAIDTTVVREAMNDWTFIPGTVDGQPQVMKVVFAVRYGASPDSKASISPVLPLASMPQKPSQTIQLAAADFDKFVGAYQVGAESFVKISREEERFLVRRTGQEDHELVAETPTKFFAADIAAEISFAFGPQGVVGLTLLQNGAVRPAKKVDDAVLQTAEANLANRIRANTPTPELEAALRRTIFELASATPNLEDLAPSLRVQIERNQSTFLIQLQALGPLKTFTFKEINSEGYDVYLVTFARGKMEWAAAPLTPEGKINILTLRNVR